MAGGVHTAFAALEVLVMLELAGAFGLTGVLVLFGETPLTPSIPVVEEVVALVTA